jgi:type II secretory pathway component PulF
MTVFDKNATVGDVIGWVVTLPMLLSSFMIGPALPKLVGNFNGMFTAIGGEMPLITRLLLAIPNALLPLPLMALAVISAWVLMKNPNNTTKALIPVLCLWLWSAYIGMIILGIFYPILQLQSATAVHGL